MLPVCFFIHNLSSHGGTERVSIALANALAQLPDFRIYFLSLESFDKPFFSLDSRIQTASLHIDNHDIRKNYFRAIKRQRKFLQANCIAVVIDVDVLLSAITLAATALTKSKVISWEHYNYYTKAESAVRRIARKLAARFSDAIVTLTGQDVEFYKTNCRVKTRIRSIANFVENMPEVAYDDVQKTILAIGHLEYRKGFDLLLDVWSKINPALRTGWKLKIVGAGEEKENLEKQILENNLVYSVEILPPTDRIEAYYREAAIYAMTSRAEGLPMVLIEAKTYGIPIIAFDCRTGPREIIHSERDGFLIPGEDPDLFAKKIMELMQDSHLRKQFSEQAIGDRNRFSMDKALEQWRLLLQSF